MQWPATFPTTDLSLFCTELVASKIKVGITNVPLPKKMPLLQKLLCVLLIFNHLRLFIRPTPPHGAKFLFKFVNCQFPEISHADRDQDESPTSADEITPCSAGPILLAKWNRNQQLDAKGGKSRDLGSKLVSLANDGIFFLSRRS